MKTIIKEYNLNSNKIKTNIVLISDIHYYNKKDINKLNRIIKNINILKPNYICITGDIIDEAIIYDEEILIKWLKELSKISKVIISIGNHDITGRRPKREYINIKLFNKIKRIKNVYLLDNEVYIDNNITFIGITNSYDYYIKEDKNIFIKELNDLKIKLNKNNYNILLCHSPISITKNLIDKCLILKNINLVLCGHTHGGITPKILRPILKNNGLISPKKKLFIKDAYGHIKRNNIDYIITSGITKASHINPFRITNFLFDEEIVNIKIDSVSK